MAQSANLALPIPKLTAERLRYKLEYCRETGVFRWRKGGPRVAANSIAGSIVYPGGYWKIKIDKMSHAAHRLAWLYVYGEWPHTEMDHINGNKLDNSIANLRLVTRSQNMCWLPKRKTNKSGYKGVYWHKPNSKWRAMIMKNGKSTDLGCHDRPEDAYAAYVEAAMRLHGEYAKVA